MGGDRRGWILPPSGRRFLRHVSEDAPFGANLVEWAKAVQLADLAYRSVAEGRWMTVPEIRL